MPDAFGDKAKDGIVAREHEVPGGGASEKVDAVERLRFWNLLHLVLTTFGVALEGVIGSAHGAWWVETKADRIEGDAGGVSQFERPRDEVS